MRKQKIGLLLILLANLLLLADVFIPHHHHESSICFSFLGQHSADHHKDLPADNRTEDKDCTGCALKHTDILLNNVERNHFKQIEITVFDFICQVSEIDINNPLLPITGYVQRITSPPLESKIYLRQQGLRAPPVA